ncbi:hypothetical protein LUW76_36110 [Actinomadura madurae]|uniref:DUF6879 family protein n=1 Tax=Actinomadura madurae TaxID=1993 RepID=UPI002025FFFD|nr:DUF6879 family protein [Actinomadura madurae]URM99320.1 hypothetical protein LUW76_36110 [Actinomadura madurae]
MGTPLTNEKFEDILAAATNSAVHLELRDAYMADSSFTNWLETGVVSTDANDEWWISTVGKAVARGVKVQRARIVSEPLSAYSRWLWECTALVNLAAGGTSAMAASPSDRRPRDASGRLLGFRLCCPRMEPLCR